MANPLPRTDAAPDAALIAAWRDGDEQAAAELVGRPARPLGRVRVAAAAAGSVPPQGAAGTGVRRDRGGTGDDTWSSPRALPSRRAETEGDSEVNDEKLENLAKRLGSGAAARLDVDATARKVVERLREQPVRRLVWVQQTWLRIAAALVIVLGGAMAVRQSLIRPGSAHTAHFVADDLNDLSADQLRDVLATFDELISGDSVAVPEGSTDLHELDAQQLRAVLRAMEG